MAESDVLAADRIHDYIDGRLSDRDRAAVAVYLVGRPRAAAEVEALRRQGEILRGIGQAVLDEPVPPRLLEPLQRRIPAKAPRSPRHDFAYLEAAAAILLLVAGGALGWQANDGLHPRPSAEDALFADMAGAHAFYGERGYPVDFAPESATELSSWIDRWFEREVPPPDLRELGYTYRGGRLIPVAGTRVGLFQFEHPEGPGLTVFFWSMAAPPQQVGVARPEEEVAARFWSGDGVNFAVVSERANLDLETAADAVFSFYQRSPGSG